MRYLILVWLAGTVLTGATITAHAQAPMTAAVVKDISVDAPPKGTFTKKRYSVKGEWEIVSVDGKPAIRFTDAFKTKNGPDLKVFLSPKPVGDLTGKTALDGAVGLGVLQSNKGGQTYTVPDGVTLADFSSVIVHCESYSVLWGGFDIPG